MSSKKFQKQYEEKEKTKQEIYDIMHEEVKFLHEEQAAMARCNMHFTGLKIKIARAILDLCEKMGY